MLKMVSHFFALTGLSVLLSLVYYVFFSEEKYSGKTQFLPSFIFSFLVVLSFALTLFYAKKIMDLKWAFSAGIAIFAVVIVLVSSQFIHAKYGFLLQHYYNKTPHSTLLGLPSFANESRNYFAVKRLVKDLDIDVTEVHEGWSGEDDAKNLQLYFINDATYVVIDWEKEEILQHLSKKELEEMFVNQVSLDTIDWIAHNGKTLYVVQNGEATNFVVLPTKSDFQFPTLKEFQGR